MSRSGYLVLGVYSALCLINLYAWPVNRYAWMLAEPDATATGLTFCSLPVDPDAMVSSALAALPVVLLLGVGLATTMRGRKPNVLLACGGGLAILWAIRFIWPQLRC